MRRQAGLTIVEVMIALAVIAVAFAALAFAQLTNLRATSKSRLASEAKTVATDVLEQKVAEMLKVTTSGTAGTYDDTSYVDPTTGNTVYASFYFVDFYYSCPSVPSSYSGRTLRNSTSTPPVTCSGSVTRAVQDGSVTAHWSVSGETGPYGEGLVDISVSAHHSAGPTVTVADRMSCYDVYPSPTIDVPVPCPTPTQTGGGRPSGSD